MSDLVQVALVSAGSAVVVAILTQLLAMRTARALASRQERETRLQFERDATARAREQHRADLREFWSLVLQAQTRVVDGLPAGDVPRQVAQSATGAAAQAYAVALLGLPSVRAAAKEFYRETASIEFSLERREGSDKLMPLVASWRESLLKVEASVTQEADEALAKAVTRGES